MVPRDATTRARPGSLPVLLRLAHHPRPLGLRGADARILGGEIAAAIDGLESAVEIHPRDPRLADVLARVLATATDARLRDGARAVELARRAWESAPSPDTADTLAMALAENGRFDEAAALAERALAARTSDRGGAPEAVERSREWLASYRRREPVREPWKV